MTYVNAIRKIYDPYPMHGRHIREVSEEARKLKFDFFVFNGHICFIKEDGSHSPTSLTLEDLQV